MPHNAKQSHGQQERLACIIIDEARSTPAALVTVALNSVACDQWFAENDPTYSRHSHYQRPVLQS